MEGVENRNGNVNVVGYVCSCMYAPVYTVRVHLCVHVCTCMCTCVRVHLCVLVCARICMWPACGRPAAGLRPASGRPLTHAHVGKRTGASGVQIS